MLLQPLNLLSLNVNQVELVDVRAAPSLLDECLVLVDADEGTQENA